MDAVPARRTQPEPRLSRREVDAVVSRAIELQVREAGDGARDQLSEHDVLRIGYELGLEAEHLRRALAEVGGGLRSEAGWLDRHVGPTRAGASRTVPLRPDEAARQLHWYLAETECMVVERRLAGATVYAPAGGIVASATRTARRLAGKHPLLRAQRVDVAVQPLGARSCCVALAVDLAGKRREAAQAGAVGGSLLGGVTGLIAAGAVAPPAALVGVPFALAAAVAARTAYRGALAEAADRADSLLDRLEHGELARPPVRRLWLLGA